MSSIVSSLGGAPQPLRRNVARAQTWMGTLASALCLFLALHQVAWSAVFKAVLQADYRLIALAMVIQVGAISVTALRWKAFFYYHTDLPASKFISVAFIGELANTFLPARLGSLVRVTLIGEIAEVSRAFALGTIMVEKIFDALMVLLILGLLSVFMSFPDWLWQAGILVLAVLVVLLGVVVVIGCGKDSEFGVLGELARDLPLLNRFDLPAVFARIADSFHALRPSKVGWRPWAGSVVISGLGVLVNLTALVALGIQVPLVVPVLLLVVLQIGAKMPSLPANIGVFEYLCLLSLSLFSVDSNLALSFGFLLHLIVLLPPALLGALSLWRAGYRFPATESA